MLRSTLVLALAVSALAAPPLLSAANVTAHNNVVNGNDAPMWGGVSDWTAKVHVKADAAWDFQYHYTSYFYWQCQTWVSWNDRYEHGKGNAVDVCKGIEGHAAGEACTIVNADDGKMYVEFPSNKDCCQCGPGQAIYPDWLSSAVSEGKKTVDGVSVNEWEKDGQSFKMFYDAEIKDNRPVQYRNSNGLVWDFTEFSDKSQPQELFQVSDSCKKNICKNSACAQLQLRAATTSHLGSALVAVEGETQPTRKVDVYGPPHF